MISISSGHHVHSKFAPCPVRVVGIGVRYPPRFVLFPAESSATAGIKASQVQLQMQLQETVGTTCFIWARDVEVQLESWNWLNRSRSPCLHHYSFTACSFCSPRFLHSRTLVQDQLYTPRVCSPSLTVQMHCSLLELSMMQPRRIQRQ
jgi:hypothetical protein